MNRLLFFIITYLYIFCFLNASIIVTNQSIKFTKENQNTIDYRIGEFYFYYFNKTKSIKITHHSNPNKTVWRTIDNKPLLSPNGTGPCRRCPATKSLLLSYYDCYLTVSIEQLSDRI